VNRGLSKKRKKVTQPGRERRADDKKKYDGHRKEQAIWKKKTKTQLEVGDKE